MDSGQLLLSWKSWFVHLLATAQMSSVSGPFCMRLARGRSNSGPGRCFCVIDVLIFSWARTCVAFVLAGVAITLTPAWGLAPQLRRHLRRRRRTALPGTPWPGNGSCPRQGIPPRPSRRNGRIRGALRSSNWTRAGCTPPVADGLTSHSRWPPPTGQWPGRTWRSALMVVPRRRRTRARRVLVFL